jgi:hypothetical protein
MTDLYITSDKPKYQIGEVARFTVTLEVDERETIDVWMKPTLWQIDHTGNPIAPEEYPDYPMHESDDDRRKMGWFVAPILRGRWGTFRAEAMVYEPERQEVGTVHVDFEVLGPPT